jgi:2,4-dienoyl-CoA reductase-like NADH-dependent reductase (Old Yellow Enzyme family)
MKLKTLFSPEKIGVIEIKNRFIRSATMTRTATDDGYITDHLIKYYTDLAEGGAGLLVTGITSVDQVGKASRGQVCLLDDSYIEGHKRLVNAVHDISNIKIATQLSHAGRQGRNPVAPSSVMYQVTKKTPKELTNEEIKEIINSFVNAGCRAYESGYDLMELNAGHGWLLCNFLSPLTNKRNDEFGGSIENRSRVLVDIYNGIIDEVGKKFPIMIRLQTQDFVEGGLSLDEGMEIAEILVDTGYAAITPSGGSGDTLLTPGRNYPSLVIKSQEDENYFLSNVKKLNPIMDNCKNILMGGVRNPLKAEEKIVDFIAIGRPLICEPDLPNRWQSGDLTPPLCNSCNSCYMSVLSGPVKCTIKRKLIRQREKERKSQQ